MFGDGFAGLIEHCKLTDLVVIGQDNPDQPEPLRDVLTEALMFQAAVPTLLVPREGVTEFKPDHAMIAWSGATTSARAVRASLPLLSLAKKATVVIVDDGRVKLEGAPGADLATYLARHEVDVSVRTVGRLQSGVGATLLGFAADENVDWMVMGAYGHSRLRQFILGGTTRSVLTSMTIPVLMAH